MSYTSPEAVAYFHSINGSAADDQNKNKNLPKSKFSRIASNQMTFVSFREATNYSTK